jgi:hypothetical protein
MKKYLKLWIACVLFSVSTGFVITQDNDQKQEKKEEKVKPLDIPTTSKSDDLIQQLDELKRDLATERKKNDSVNTLRQTNLNLAEKSLSDLRKANAQYRKSLGRLKFILEKFPPDTVMKYYGEYQEPIAEPDTSKKKIDPVKRSFFQRLFRRK